MIKKIIYIFIPISLVVSSCSDQPSQVSNQGQILPNPTSPSPAPKDSLDTLSEDSSKDEDEKDSKVYILDHVYGRLPTEIREPRITDNSLDDKIEQNGKKPLVFDGSNPVQSSVAGVAFNMSYAEASEILSPSIVGGCGGNGDYYRENLCLLWTSDEPRRLRQAFVLDGYLGSFEFPEPMGLQPPKAELSQFFNDELGLDLIVKTYNKLFNEEEGYNCIEEQTCEAVIYNEYINWILPNITLIFSKDRKVFISMIINRDVTATVAPLDVLLGEMRFKNGPSVTLGQTWSETKNILNSKEEPSAIIETASYRKDYVGMVLRVERPGVYEGADAFDVDQVEPKGSEIVNDIIVYSNYKESIMINGKYVNAVLKEEDGQEKVHVFLSPNDPTEKFKELEAQTAKAKAKVEKLETQAAKAEAEVEELETEAAEVEVEELEAQTAKAKAKVEKLETQAAKAEAEVEELETEAAEVEVEELEAQTAKAKAKVKELEAQTAKARAEAEFKILSVRMDRFARKIELQKSLLTQLRDLIQKELESDSTTSFSKQYTQKLFGLNARQAPNRGMSLQTKVYDSAIGRSITSIISIRWNSGGMSFRTTASRSPFEGVIFESIKKPVNFHSSELAGFTLGQKVTLKSIDRIKDEAFLEINGKTARVKIDLYASDKVSYLENEGVYTLQENIRVVSGLSGVKMALAPIHSITQDTTQIQAEVIYLASTANTLPIENICQAQEVQEELSFIPQFGMSQRDFLGGMRKRLRTQAWPSCFPFVEPDNDGDREALSVYFPNQSTGQKVFFGGRILIGVVKYKKPGVKLPNTTLQTGGQ